MVYNVEGLNTMTTKPKPTVDRYTQADCQQLACLLDGIDEANPSPTVRRLADMFHALTNDTDEFLVISPAWDPEHDEEVTDEQVAIPPVPKGWETAGGLPEGASAELRLAVLQDAVSAYDAKLDDPEGNGSGNGSRSPTGDDFNKICRLVRKA